MELSRLKAFYHVARYGSFSKAAENLFTSQPALSRQVAALEKELGLKLFSRQARGVVLTEAGRRLLDYAGQVFELVEEAERLMAELKNLEAGHLRLGASVTVGNYLLPLFLDSAANNKISVPPEHGSIRITQSKYPGLTSGRNLGPRVLIKIHLTFQEFVY